MKSIRFLVAALACAAPVQPASARDFRPPGHRENLPGEDASVRQCYVFQTVPGIRYTVEMSDDLGNWTQHETIYGLGHEYVVTMREFTPPPPPPPGSPPPALPPQITLNASIRMQPASGGAGGTVVAWASLDGAGPVVVRIDGEMDAAWNQVPLYAKQFGNYGFLVWHPVVAIAPPASNPLLGPKDSSVLAALEENLPAMNLEVANSAARARNAPPPPPPAPGSRRFWRVLVDSGADTDSDGSPDWAEFEMAAAGAGVLVPGVTPDPFSADTNADGIPDGDQLDTDGDGIPDTKDSAPTDNTAAFPIGPTPRYALPSPTPSRRRPAIHPFKSATGAPFSMPTAPGPRENGRN